MENESIFKWNPGELKVDADDDAEAMYEEMDKVVYPDDHDHGDEDPDTGGIPVAARTTIITDDEELDEMDEDRSNNADEYEGDWTQELNEEDEQEEQEDDYESRSYTEDSQELVMEEVETQDKAELSEEEETLEEGDNTGATGVTRLEPSMKGKSHGDTHMQFTQKGTTTEEKQYEWFTKLNDIAVNVCFTQISARKGIEQFRKLAVAAMLKEYKQLDDLLVFGAVSPEFMSKLKKKRALQAINLIKLKRCGKVKGRTCADGSVQRGYISKEDSLSPTISLQALFTT